MSNGIDTLATNLQKIIAERDKNKKTGYDTEATVIRVDGDIVWVKIPGGIDETPAQKTVNAKEGDSVQVRVSGGKAFLIGNGTNPPTDDTIAYVAINNAQDANNNAQIAGIAADMAINSASFAVEKANEANAAAIDAKADAAIANTAANQAAEDAGLAQSAAGRAIEDAAAAQTAANEAKADAATAQTAANEAKDDAARANTAANGAVTSLGIVQGVVDGLSTDMDEMQTHVAMMDAITDPQTGEVLVPAGLHIVPTSNGYFIVVSNDGMYVYDDQSDLVATFSENIFFDSVRPQKIGGDNAYIEYYDSNNDGKADSIRIVGANISSSTGIPTKVSDLQNDSNFTTQTYVDNAVGNNATDLANYISSNNEALEELQTQIDGAIDTWYYAVDPTTSNEPAVNWTTTAQKDSHLRDLYFNTSNGHTFRWAKEGNTYKWIQIQDADAIKALADAAAAQSTADTKRRVFVSQPTPPYDIGDLWVQGSTGDIKKCKIAKTSAQSYAASDWELASKYTDDSSLNTFINTTYATDIQQTNDAISLRATKTEAQGYADTAEANAKADTTTKLANYYTKTQTDSAITQKAGEISLSVAQEEISKIEIGGRNLLGATDNPALPTDQTSSASMEFRSIGRYNISASEVSLEDYDGYSNSMNITSSATGNRGVAWYTKPAEIKVGETYTFSCRIKPNVSVSAHTHTAWRNGSATAGYVGWTSGGTKTISADSWTDYSYTFTPASNAQLDWEFLVGICFTGQTTGVTCYIAHAKLERGNKATDWTPAPEDLENYTDTQISSAKAEIKVTTDGISTEVSNKVGNNEVISKINQSAEEILIQASKIAVDGDLIIGRTDAQELSDEAAKVATNYITEITEGGISIHTGSDPGTYLRLTAMLLEFYLEKRSMSKFGYDEMFESYGVQAENVFIKGAGNALRLDNAVNGTYQGQYILETRANGHLSLKPGLRRTEEV